MEQDSSERLNQITLADMEFIPNTAYVYFEFFGTSNVGENELKQGSRSREGLQWQRHSLHSWTVTDQLRQ